MLFGSAITGQGLPELLDGIAELFPAVPRVAEEGPATGTVFAIERAASGEKVAYARIRSGTLRVREPLTFYRGQRHSGADGLRPSDGAGTRGGGSGHGGATTHSGGSGDAGHGYEARLTALSVAGAAGEAHAVAGDIVRLWGVPEIRVGDHLGEPGPAGQAYFTPPGLETVVRPRVPGQEPRLHAALLALAEQDPLIGTRTLPGGDTSVLLYGEVQKEVIGETLARDFGVEAGFEPSRPVYFERPAGTGEAAEEIQRQGRNDFMATVGLRVEPAPRGSGIAYRLEVDLGSLPAAFHRAIEESVRLALREGPRGWPVTDVLVTLTRTGYSSPVTVAADFRGRARVVLARALRRAGTVVYEPCHRFEAEVPLDAFGPVTAQLAGLGGELREARRDGEGWVLEGEIPAAMVHEVERRLPGLSHGEGVWWSEPAGDRQLR
ncbi:hypothetical protein ACFQ0B_39760 [Nonomuraea thailandensis]